MAYDVHGLLVYSTISGGGVINSTTGTSIQLNPATDSLRFSANQNITAWPSGVNPSQTGGGIPVNSEIMRVNSVDNQQGILTVTRAQEGSVALSNITAGYQIANTITPKVLTDIQTQAFNTINIQSFTSSGTYTPTSGMVYCIIECVGGGGAGGGTVGANGAAYSGAGGGSGSYSRSVVTAATISSSQTVTCGAGGTGSSGNGGSGSATSVGSIITANGGSGGQYGSSGQLQPAGGAGGTVGTANFAIVGNPGTTTPIMAAATTDNAVGGNGGVGSFGGGAVGISSLSGATNGAAGTSGSGGAGATSYNTTSSASGGAGGTGVVLITEFI